MCPDDAYERAQTLQWMFFEQYSHEPHIAVARFWIAYSESPDRSSADDANARMKGGYAALDAMEGHLAERAFLVGERYTIADISLYAYTHVAHEGEFDLEPYPAIRLGSSASALSRGTSRSTPEPCPSVSASPRVRRARCISGTR